MCVLPIRKLVDIASYVWTNYFFCVLNVFIRKFWPIHCSLLDIIHKRKLALFLEKKVTGL